MYTRVKNAHPYRRTRDLKLEKIDKKEGCFYKNMLIIHRKNKKKEKFFID